MNYKRIRKLKDGIFSNGPIVYWMQRDQRLYDNWALIYAYQKAEENNEQLIIVYNLVTNFLQGTLRQYHFMIEGLKEFAANSAKLNIPFFLLTGKPEDEIPKFLKSRKASILITDFNPIKIVTDWKDQVKSRINIPFFEIDAHNIVPVWEASQKLEYAAYTIRPKIKSLLPEFLDAFPTLKKFKKNNFPLPNICWEELYKSLKIDTSVKPVKNILPGENSAKKALQNFIDNKLTNYNIDRNDPNKDALSGISPYLHFGQISAQRIALILNQFSHENDSIASYMEELIVRRELSDNFCLYNTNYDNFDGFSDWSKTTLNIHRGDKREYLYTLNEFEMAQTHDSLWNAAQLEMVNTGKMHGYMRMYWAKKILEWSESPEQALKFGIYLNDKYELDGRDPNGYAGLAWSIGGTHDRAWTERPVFGKIRYMNYNGCKRKFDVANYIQKITNMDKQKLF